MKEIFIIYNSKVTLPDGGHPINGGMGRIDRDWDEAHKDGSTMSERIPKILAKDLDRKVIYLPDQDILDSRECKIKDGKMVKLTEQDEQAIEVAKPKSEIELLKERVTVLEK